MREITIAVGYMGPSLNSIYAGIHWAKRKMHADEAHRAVMIATRNVELFNRPVSIAFFPKHKGRHFDVSNYAYTAKLIEDGLVLAGVLSDDTNRYVKQLVLNEPERLKEHDSYMLVRIREALDE